MRFSRVSLQVRGRVGVGCAMVLLLVTGCQRAAPVDQRREEQVIRALDGQWSQTANHHDLEGALAFYADDAVLLPPDEPAAVDKAAIRASWVGTLGVFTTLSWQTQTVGVAQSGDLAYATGAWSATVKGPGGASIPVKGKLLEVWKKQADGPLAGQWKCVADTFNSDAPAGPAPAGL